MSTYVDGFVLPVPKDKLDDYKKLASLASQVWKEHGALSYVEALADDVKMGEVTSFPQSVLLEEDEVVIFAYITYKSREHRDEVNKKVFEDSRMNDMSPEGMPFDGKRMFWGGFQAFIEK